MIRRMTVAAGALAALAYSPADAAEDFYKDKQIKVIVGDAAGGAIEQYVRTVTRYMGKHIPGNPTFVPQYMEGAGSRVAANYLYNVAAKDGTVIGNVSQGTALDQVRKEQGIQFDVAKFNWIGNPLVANLSVTAWTPSGYRSMDDVKQKGGLICGGSGGSAPTIVQPRILANLIDANITVISGYKGNNDVGLAMERGELNCLGALSTTAARVLFSAHMSDNKIAFLVQFGTVKDPTVSAFVGHDVPLITELAKADQDRKALGLITSGTAFGRLLFAPPGVPKERIDILRRGFDETMKDPEFLADAEKQKMDVNPIAGEKLQQLAIDVSTASEDVVARATALAAPRATEQQKK
jgi:tripartite-type tricarboxylate transporter receptor subunit TctC